ncbi:hypothetical protein HUE58_04445 [Candidatus Ruthia endofausta]|uniref:Uncharacterized protein n=1 Tax=Candidatus Ruthia endofausta TaxID=2738852 RepID=A0A6N0HQ69_9GAMM|nr:hypothetical protein [Candidatus Ruthia endofausta]QKQ24380.1 hypothetical protein HUE58_04445 [Candidatus Ruthia endofausta]
MLLKTPYGIGVKFNSEDLKLKLELNKNFIKTGMVTKFNPFKTGLNLSNQKLISGDNAYARINQYSVALNVIITLTL